MVEPFQIRVPDSDLEDLHRRLRGTRLGSAPADEPWESGVDYQYLTGVIEYWRGDFDWRVQERRLNAFPQFLANVAGEQVHFVQIRADPARYSEVVPIILSHGWPYSFVEFLDFAGWLTDPLAGGLAFDVVIPSLPGYGFSPPLADRPFIASNVAELFHSLMTEELGYDRYATYGEDVGASVSDWLGALHPESIMGLFATHAAFPPDERTDDLSDAEQAFRNWLSEKWKSASAYSAIQSTRPDTLAVGLGDSPAGLLAWFLEKFKEWSGPDFEETWSFDDILTTTSLYWFTRSIGTSFLPYFHGRNHDSPLPMVHVPVGVAVQWGERGFPREYAERSYTDLRTWVELPRGGHFTAKQTPDLVASAMREFFSAVLL